MAQEASYKVTYFTYAGPQYATVTAKYVYVGRDGVIFSAKRNRDPIAAFPVGTVFERIV